MKSYSALVLDAIFPEPTSRKLLAHYDRATLNETVADAKHAASRVVERQCVIDDVITTQLEEIEH